MIHNISRFIAALALLATAQGAWADTETVSYIDADGNTQTATATVLSGGGATTIGGGWYVVTEAAVTYSGPITVSSGGDVHLILANDASVTINSSYGAAIYFEGSGNLTIYGQDKGNGILIANAGPGGDGISLGGDLTINGGCVTARKGGDDCDGICASYGSTITLNPTRHANSICSDGYRGTSFTLKVADGKTLYDHTTPYSGTLDSDQIAAIAGKILRPDSSTDWTDNGDGTYTIESAAGWGVFCDLIDGGESFSGKTVTLGTDITVSRMAGIDSKPFCGTFDGDGHTLTLDYGTAESPIDAQFVAPFVMTTWNTTPTFRNLTIDGHIYDGYTGSEAHNVGGLIGHLYGTVTIEHCTSNVTITSTGGAGGFVGLCEHTVNFTDCVSSAVVHSAGGNNSGFVAWSRASGYAISFAGCVFNGKLLQIDGNGNSNGGFIGWTGSNKTVTITNSLCAPAPLADGETMASSNSATFARGWNATTTATNSYYTAALGTAQGKAVRSVTAGTDVILYSPSPLNITNTYYNVSGIRAYTTGGLYYNHDLYYGSGDRLSILLENTRDDEPLGYRYTYAFSGGTADEYEYSADYGGTSYHLTMPDENVTISVNTAALLSTGQPVSVSYVDAGGNTQTAQAIALDGHEAVDGDGDVRLAGTYYVGTDIAYANRIWPDGDVTLILVDGKTMTLNGNKTGIYGGYNLTIYGQSLDAATAGTLRYDGTADGITADNYVQHSGNVSITTTGSSVSGIDAKVTLRGGALTITANGDDALAIFGYTHSILGGQLTATATGSNATGIRASDDEGTVLTLGWTRPADFITVSSIRTDDDGGTVAVKDGQALCYADGDNKVVLSGTLTSEQITALAGKTLQPCLALADAADNTAAIADHAGQTLAVALSGRTLYKDGSWNTLCLPFAVEDADATDGLTFTGTPLQGADARELLAASIEGATLNLTFSNPVATIQAGKPYIIKWTPEDGYVDDDAHNLVAPEFPGVTISNADNSYDTADHAEAKTVGGISYPAVETADRVRFLGTYAAQTFTEENRSILFMGLANTLYYPQPDLTVTPAKYPTIGAQRAYFKIGTDVQQARRLTAFNLNFGDGDASGIIEISTSRNPDMSNPALSNAPWYTLDGRRLPAQPAAPGMYIYGGKKVIIK